MPLYVSVPQDHLQTLVCKIKLLICILKLYRNILKIVEYAFLLSATQGCLDFMTVLLNEMKIELHSSSQNNRTTSCFTQKKCALYNFKTASM
jgi:hypothetical protein